MTERSIELLQQALSLTEEERADLAASLLNSLETASDPDAEALWQEEISRRATSLDSGQSRTIPWREVQSQVSAALQHGPKNVEFHEEDQASSVSSTVTSSLPLVFLAMR
jgi:putative addiction module component (TIGR02574 family)